MSAIRFEVKGEPRGKGRPRFASHGKFVKAYTPVETENYEAFVKVNACRAANGLYLNGPLKAEIDCIYSIPSSWSKRKKAEAVSSNVPCTKKPDADNIAKTVLDSLNGLLYDDDKQVVELVVRKRYGVMPRVEVTLMEIRKEG